MKAESSACLRDNLCVEISLRFALNLVKGLTAEGAEPLTEERRAGFRCVLSVSYNTASKLKA